jgi:hypothetical protein
MSKSILITGKQASEDFRILGMQFVDLVKNRGLQPYSAISMTSW